MREQMTDTEKWAHCLPTWGQSRF